MKNKFLCILVFLPAFVLVADFCLIFSINAFAMDYPTEKSEVTNQEIVSGGEEIVLEEAGLYFQLPSDEWKFTDRAEFGDKRILYVYKRKPITDQSGTSIIPAICISFDKLPKDYSDLMGYAFHKTSPSRQKDSPYTNFKMRGMHPTGFIKEVSGPFADMSLHVLGQVFTYNDPAGRQHTNHSVFAIIGISPDENIGIWIYMDVTTELLPIIKEEFMYTLKTIKFVEKQE